MTGTASPFTVNDLSYDEATHTTKAPDGRDVPHVTHILKAVGVSTDFEGLAGLSTRLADVIDAKCNLGTLVHQATHDFDDCGGGEFWDDVTPFVRAWAYCRESLGLTPVARERRIFHPTYWYTGITDGVFLSLGDRRILVDLKIGDPYAAAAEFQTAAYEAAWNLDHPNEIIDERWAIRLCPELQIPYRVTNYSARPDAWRDFQKFQAFLTTYHEQSARRRRV